MFRNVFRKLLNSVFLHFLCKTFCLLINRPIFRNITPFGKNCYAICSLFSSNKYILKIRTIYNENNKWCFFKTIFYF